MRKIKDIVQNSQEPAIRSVNFEPVLMYWHIGKVIFEEEQQGQDCTVYGKFLIKSLSKTFQAQFEKIAT